jgi:hypothetical protein
MRFSQTIGKTVIRQILQVESIDENLANQLLKRYERKPPLIASVI